MPRKLIQFVRKHELLRPGERVGVAVSGGADSTALLRLLDSARSELGIVLSVAHFNHKLRGQESDEDERFVRELAQSLGVDLHASSEETARFAREKELSLEAAARELRYAFFGKLIQENRLDKVATAHTLDDQAETVLLRLFRGTGTSGLAGIQPRLKVGDGAVIRPLLWARHGELVGRLEEMGQSWREDSTNNETRFTRNRLRHQLLPEIASGFNPEIKEALANLAEIARAEDECWAAQTAQAFVEVYRNRQVDISALRKLPLAIQRRVLRLAAIQAGASLDFHHAERILEQLDKPHCMIELPNGFRAALESGGLRFEANEPQPKPCGYSYRLTIPGAIELAELGLRVSATVVGADEDEPRYNDEPRLALDRLPRELLVRNWRPGDRFWPAHTRTARKVKELLQERHLPAREKALWPVVVAGDELVWMRDFPVATPYVARNGKAVIIIMEAVPLSPERD